MEFWGVEVKPGATVKCDPEEERYIHLSQASLGESKVKGNENVLISVKVNDKKLVLGTLSLEKCPQISYDIVFEKEFEVSHNSKSASVYFCGYRTGSPEEESEGDDHPESESEEEEVPADLIANGKPLAKQEQGKPVTGKVKAAKEDSSAAKKADPVKVEKTKSEDEDEEDSDDDDDDSEKDSEDDEDMAKAMSDSDDEDDSSEEEDEAAPKNSATGKRPVESASKTPAPEKKAKVVTPTGGHKTGDGKKVVHVATPYPSKKAGKTITNSDKSKQHTPKSAGSVTCKSCNRNFNSENGLQAHTKAKHG